MFSFSRRLDGKRCFHFVVLSFSCFGLSLSLFSPRPVLSQTLVSLHHYGIPVTFISHSWSAYLLRVTLQQALVTSLIQCLEQEQHERGRLPSSSTSSTSPPHASIESQGSVSSKEEEGKGRGEDEVKGVESNGDSKGRRSVQRGGETILPQEADRHYSFQDAPDWIKRWAESVVKGMSFRANELEYDPNTGVSTGIERRRTSLR